MPDAEEIADGLRASPPPAEAPTTSVTAHEPGRPSAAGPRRFSRASRPRRGPPVSVITILATVLAVAGALAYNRRVWRPRQTVDHGRADGLTITEVAVPLVTHAVSAALAGLTLGEDGRTAGTRCPGDQADDDKRN